MATASETLSFIKNNYRFEDLGDNMLKLLFDTNDDRSQLVYAHISEHFLTLSSPFADKGKVKAERVFDVADGLLGVGLFGEYYVAKHLIPIEDLDPSEVGVGFGLIANVADGYEAALGLSDNF